VSGFAKLALIFGTSALVLILQLLQSRILAVQFWHHLVYFVITLGFLGFAASGTYLSVSQRIHSISDRLFFAICLAGLSLGMLVSRVILAALLNSHFGFLDLGSILPLTLAYTALMVPYFFAGLLVGGALRREPRAGGTLYFSSLAGSAVGCLGFVALIRPLGAPGLLQVLFVAAALPALLLWRPDSRLYAVSIAGVVVATFILGVLPIQPDRGKQYWSFPGEPVEFTEWNPISRVDVISTRRMPWKKFILIDGDAQAPMFQHAPPALGGAPVPLDTPHREALYALTWPARPQRVLVIGVGGGADVLTAKRHGAKTVDAVEINPTSARIVRGEYAEFTGHLLSSGGITLHYEDGRSFAARTRNRYDAVMLFAVDSLAASSTGAYVLMENYLYTFEAFQRYWQLLSDHGVLQIGRWHHPKAPSETLRVFTQSFEALGASGIKDPGRHIAVVGDPPGGGAPFADILVSKQPLTGSQADAIRRFAEINRFELVYLHPSLGGEPAAGRSNAFHRFAAAYGAGESRQFYNTYLFNVAPVTDNDPFFFSYRRWSDVLPHQAEPSVTYYDNILGTKPLVLLVVLVGLSVALVLALVAWRALRVPDRRVRAFNLLPALVLLLAIIGLNVKELLALIY